jgi:alcohol dehydrogenase class IV
MIGELVTAERAGKKAISQSPWPASRCVAAALKMQCPSAHCGTTSGAAWSGWNALTLAAEAAAAVRAAAVRCVMALGAAEATLAVWPRALQHSPYRAAHAAISAGCMQMPVPHHSLSTAGLKQSFASAPPKTNKIDSRQLRAPASGERERRADGR